MLKSVLLHSWPTSTVHTGAPVTILLFFHPSRGRPCRRNSPHWDCYPADLALHAGQSAGPVPSYWWRWTSSGGECLTVRRPLSPRIHTYNRQTTESFLFIRITQLTFFKTKLIKQSLLSTGAGYAPPTALTHAAIWMNIVQHMSVKEWVTLSWPWVKGPLQRYGWADRGSDRTSYLPRIAHYW